MIKSTATTEFNAREELQKYFEKYGLSAFQRSINSQRDMEFYSHVLNKLEHGVDLSIEMPELKIIKNSMAKRIVKKLIADAEKSIPDFWESPINTMNTSMRYALDESSLLPRFDVLYKAQLDKYAVKIRLKTWRRNLSVVVDGDISACDNLYAQLITATLRKAN
jgi:hypothetical protein